MLDRLKQKHQLPRLTDNIVATYNQCEVPLHHLETTPLPSRESVVQITEILQETIFPGYFGKKGLDTNSIRYHIGDSLESVYEMLFREIYRGIRHGCQLSESVCTHCEDIAENQTIGFLEKIPEIRNALAQDVEAAYDGDPAAKGYGEIIFSYPCIFAIMVYRLAHELNLQGIPLLPRIMTEFAHSKTGIDIHPGAKIGKYFFIDHGTGVVVGETCEIGNNVKLYQGVTLGALSFPKDADGKVIRGKKRHPTIEDNVVIYSGATVLGGNTVIGEGSVIGGNVWLTHSVPPRTKVLIAEPQLIMDPIPKLVNV
ncbi:MAG TPA: serine O-acetyltransferase EpsC [Terriglobia bacterium]|nr:serine O-acetyltransferase EpsC [Terriglobia bacterium]